MVFVSLILICTACIRDNSEEGTFILKSGDKLPAFSITLNNGLEVTNEEFRGKVSLIVFFNTGCPDCRKELPVIQEVYEYGVMTVVPTLGDAIQDNIDWSDT